MKLRNKLIPLISLTATAAAVAPLASCGNVSLTETAMTDVLHGYLPDIARAEASDTLTAEQAKDLYVDHIKKNPEIFAQDMYWWESLALKYRLRNACFGSNLDEGTEMEEKKSKTNYVDDGSFMGDLNYLYGLVPATVQAEYSFDMVPLTAKFSVTDVSVGEAKLVNPSYEEETGYTISLKMNYEYKYELNADCVHGTSRYAAKRETTVSLTSEYKNIPFTVMWDTEWATWRIVPVGWFTVPGNNSNWILQKLNNWSFNFDKKSVTVDTIKNYDGGVDTYTYDESQGGLIDSWAEMVKWIKEAGSSTNMEAAIRTVIFNFGSYHLYDIAGPQWAWSNLGGLNYSKATGKIDKDNLTTTTYTESAFNRNWTIGEYQSGTCPLNWTVLENWDLLDVGSPIWKLNACSLVDVPVYKVDAKTQTLIAKASILPAANTDMYCDESSTSETLGLYTTLNFKLTDEKEMQETYYKNLVEAVNTGIVGYYTFTIPQGTTFTFSVPYLDEEGEAIVYKEETITITDDIKCFWSSTDELEEI